MSDVTATPTVGSNAAGAGAPAAATVGSNAAGADAPAASGVGASAAGANEPAAAVGAPLGAPHVSGELIRRALLGEAEAPADVPLKLDRSGARLEGAIIEDELDLSGVRFDRPIRFERCLFQGPVRLGKARLADLSIIACRAPTIDAQYAGIEGDFELDGSSIGDGKNLALDARYMRISGEVKLNGCIADGPVSFNNTVVGGDFWCLDSTLECPTHERATPVLLPASMALSCQGTEIKGLFHLSRFRIEGLAVFRAQIRAFVIEDGSVVAGRGSSSGMVLVGSQIGGLAFERLREFEGGLHLSPVRVGQFGDDGTLWRDPATGERRPGVTLHLIEFRYDGFIAQLGKTADVDWRLRLAWLKAQSPDVLGARFHPQPFTQCAEVLRNKGEAHGSRMILFERERLRLKAKNVGFWERLAGRAIGVLAGYGYKNHYALYWALAIWLVGALIFGAADTLGEMRPADPHVLVDAEYRTTHRPPADYEPVNALLYSADIFLPIVELGQQQYWIPRNAGERRADARASMPELPPALDTAIDWLFSGWLPKTYYYFEIIMGWVLASIVIAGFSGLLGHAREQ